MQCGLLHSCLSLSPGHRKFPQDSVSIGSAQHKAKFRADTPKGMVSATVCQVTTRGQTISYLTQRPTWNKTPSPDCDTRTQEVSHVRPSRRRPQGFAPALNLSSLFLPGQAALLFLLKRPQDRLWAIPTAYAVLLSVRGRRIRRPGLSRSRGDTAHGAHVGRARTQTPQRSANPDPVCRDGTATPEPGCKHGGRRQVSTSEQKPRLHTGLQG